MLTIKVNLQKYLVQVQQTVISPVGTLRYEDREIVINNNEPGEITQNFTILIQESKVAN